MEAPRTIKSDHDLHRPFRFFDLPLELRSKILSMALSLNRTIDLDPLNNFDAPQRLDIFLTSRRFHHEAYHVFYGEHTFRVFPTHWRFFGDKVVPLVSRLSHRYRKALLTLELRLGPGWSNPPKSWRVSDKLGLDDMVRVRKVKVFMECDPSLNIFRGFRFAKDFFTDFAGKLLEGIINRLPVLEEIEFDSYPSVPHDGPLMARLVNEAKGNAKRVVWGPDLSLRNGAVKEQIALSNSLYVNYD